MQQWCHNLVRYKGLLAGGKLRLVVRIEGMASEAVADCFIDRHIISPSILKQVASKTSSKHKREFLLGVGEPFELNPWDMDFIDSDEDNTLFLASQALQLGLHSYKGVGEKLWTALLYILNWSKKVKTEERKGKLEPVKALSCDENKCLNTALSKFSNLPVVHLDGATINFNIGNDWVLITFLCLCYVSQYWQELTLN